MTVGVKRVNARWRQFRVKLEERKSRQKLYTVGFKEFFDVKGRWSGS